MITEIYTIHHPETDAIIGIEGGQEQPWFIAFDQRLWPGIRAGEYPRYYDPETERMCCYIKRPLSQEVPYETQG